MTKVFFFLLFISGLAEPVENVMYQSAQGQNNVQSSPASTLLPDTISGNLLLCNELTTALIFILKCRIVTLSVARWYMHSGIYVAPLFILL